MTHRVFRFLLGICLDAKTSALAEMNALTSKVSGVPLDPPAYAIAKARYDRAGRLAKKLVARQHNDVPARDVKTEARLGPAYTLIPAGAPDENVSVPGSSVRCACELDETAVRVHLALVWDVPWSNEGSYAPAQLPVHERATVAPDPHRRFPFTARIEDGSLVLTKRPFTDTTPLPLGAAIAVDRVSVARPGQRRTDPPRKAREWAKHVRSLCEATGCARHFPNVDRERELGLPVYTSSDPEKQAEDARELEAGIFAEERMSWHERFEARGDDALDSYTRASRRERGLRDEAAIAKRIRRRNHAVGTNVAVTQHEPSQMRRRWATETPKGQRWLATKQRVEKTRWQEFYRLARALGRNPATPEAKAWVESVGMDAALETLRAAVERRAVAA